VQPLAQLLLAVERLAVDEVEEDGLAARFHGVEGTQNTPFQRRPVHDYASISIELAARDVYKYSF
jgi:hypothetical protein